MQGWRQLVGRLALELELELEQQAQRVLELEQAVPERQAVCNE